MTDLILEQTSDYTVARFRAMASPCEILLDTRDASLARKLGAMARAEALRIEQKFSRYRDDNIIHRINHANGAPVEVDDETAALLDYADTCWRLSEGAFDVTSGILRRAWRFDGSDRVPPHAAVDTLLPLIGWDKVRWEKPRLTLKAGMEIDLGGIGKEYAVDRSAQLIGVRARASALVNYGGDLMTTGPRANGDGWVIGIENPDRVNDFRAAAKHAQTSFELVRGGLATSGDTRRYVLKDGKRYGHILDPRTGWPVAGAPRSVTVVAGSCTEAGILATLAMLRGPGAEAFLTEQNVRFWCVR